jgi:aminomethyltransferase
MAVQGSAAWTVIGRCFKQQLLPGLPYYGIGQFDFSGAPCWIARLGYSGESGGELVVADAAAPALWQALLAAGADAGMIECGFDAADALRIEAGHILFARELASRVFPGELGFTRFVDFDRAPFHGMRALQSRRRQPPWRRLTGLLPRHESWPSGQALPDRIVCGNAVLTSACWSPIYARQIGIGFVNADDACPGTTVKLTSGVTARTARLPFYDPAKRLARNAR